MTDQLHDSHDIPTYVYTPLRKEHDEIRVLVLEPAWDPMFPIQVSFEVLNRSQKSSYEALSYTWGDLNLTHRVLVHQAHQLPITQNLDQALRRLRQRVEKRRLWIDALCINQSDNREKSSQIPRMHSIYHNAKTVIAWLGAGGEAEIAGMKSLQDLSRWSVAKVVGLRRMAKFEHLNYAEEAGIAALLSLPWFTRMWIIQEVVFNIDVRLMCGIEEISWVRFTTSLQLYQDICHQSARRNGLTDKLVEIAAISSLWRQHSMFGIRHYDSRDGQILGMLQEFAHYQCSDPRDRIFSLYNMATDMKNPLTNGEDSDMSSPEIDIYTERLIEFDVDYSLDIPETFRSFALACARLARTDQLLQAVVDRNVATEPSNWPSWVPDWRLKPVSQGEWFNIQDEPLLHLINYAPDALLLQSSKCIANASQQSFVYIDYIGPTVTATDSMDSIIRKIGSFYRTQTLSTTSGAPFEPGNFAETLALHLKLTPEATDKLKDHLLRNIPTDNTTQKKDTRKEDSDLRHTIIDAMRGKQWFRARHPESSYLGWCGMTSSSIVLGDELLVDRSPLYNSNRTTMTGIIVRRTSTAEPAAVVASSRNSYRVIGRASLTWAFVGFLFDLTDMQKSEQRPCLIEFWLE